MTEQTQCPTCHGSGTFTPVDGQPGERCPYCPHLYPPGRLATYQEIRDHDATCTGQSEGVVTWNAELDPEPDAGADQDAADGEATR